MAVISKFKYRGWRARGLGAAVLLAACALVGYFAFSRTPWLLPQRAVAPSIIGQASVIDGDTIEIDGTRIRLYGIDAPESSQNCYRAGKPVRCGQRASRALADKIASTTVSCEAKDRDQNGRVVAVCRARGQDLNAWMVEEGLALAYRHYSSDYVAHEDQAKAAKRGIWQEEFIFPWDWRRENPRTPAGASFKQAPTGIMSQEAAATACNIKGNISASGQRIYHLPGGDFYRETVINVGKGERWFCSEAEAQAAGWRRSRR